MPGMIERKIEDHPENIRNVLIEAKIDGGRHTWDGQRLLSERDIDRSDRFPHIVAELKKMPWEVRGEVAIPMGNVLQLNKRENWPKARFYAFDMFNWQGLDTRDSLPLENRQLIKDAFGQAPRFDHLRYPFAFKDFATGWAHVLKHKLEGLVLKQLDGRKTFKTKKLSEEKIPIVGFIPGAAKGAFIIERKGVSSKISGTSAYYVDKYNAMLAAGECPYAEVEYLFLTDNGKPFQPRLRAIDTLANLKKG